MFKYYNYIYINLTGKSIALIVYNLKLQFPRVKKRKCNFPSFKVDLG